VCRNVVADGTGTEAQIAGYRVAGETGTAQMPGPNDYTTGKYVASFVGCVARFKAAARRARQGAGADEGVSRRCRWRARIRRDRMLLPAVPRGPPDAPGTK